jgi:two-component system response regulator MprA
MAALSGEHRHIVLLAEDDHDTRATLVEAAKLAGLDFLAVANGRDALEQLRGGLRPCLIVLDLSMPIMNGLDFRRAQLDDPALTDLPIVVVSGGGWAAECDARELGLTTFLHKPVVLSQLLSVLENHCGGSLP